MSPRTHGTVSPASLRRGARARRALAGYTLVEVMVALSVLAVGVTGVLALQNAAILSNRRAQEMTIASNIARRWQERLRRDAMQWNSPSQFRATSDLATDTTHLCEVAGCFGGGVGGGAGNWFVPATVGSGTSLESPAFDTFGNDVAVNSTRARYCTNLRLYWLQQSTATQQGIIRAEVRVWWYREGAARPAAYANCGSTPAALAELGRDVANLSFVYMSTAIGGNPL